MTFGSNLDNFIPGDVRGKSSIKQMQRSILTDKGHLNTRHRSHGITLELPASFQENH